MVGLVKQVSGLCASLALSLGVWNSAQAQAVAMIPAPPVYPTVDQNGVDLTTGQVALRDNQTTVGQQGEGGLSRTFLGAALRDNLTGVVNIQSSVITVNVGEHSTLFENAAGFRNISGEASTLNYDAAAKKYVYTMPDGSVANYDATLTDGVFISTGGVVTSLVKPNGETLTYTYNSYRTNCSNTCYRLQAVTSNLGYMVKYEYAGNDVASGSLNLTRVTAYNLANDYCSPAAATCAFTRVWSTATFTGASLGGGTITVKDSLNQVTTYVQSPSNAITQIKRPSGLTVTYSYGLGNDPLSTESRVSSVATPSGTWTYDWVMTSDSNLQVTITDPLTHHKVVKIDRQTNPLWRKVVSVTDENGNVTTYTPDTATGRLVKVTYPEGNYTTFAYDNRGNVKTVTKVAKAGSGLPNYVTTASYDTTCGNPKTCNKPNAIVANGAQTDFTYDPTHGGVLTVTGPATANGVRPQTRYSYGSFYASYMTSATSVGQAPTPVYKLIATSACNTLSICVGSADETRTTMSYGPVGGVTNLQVNALSVGAGDGSLTSTTAFTYNIFGDVRTIDGPLAGAADTVRRRYDTNRQLVGQIEVDPDGVGVGRPALATRYSYDADGRRTSTDIGTVASQTDTDWLAFATSQQILAAYDGAGRVASESVIVGGAVQSLIQYSYDAANRLDCTAQRMNPAAFSTLPASACTMGTVGSAGPDRISRTNYDAAGQVLSVTGAYGASSPFAAATSTYSPNGRTLTITDAKGNLTTYAWDGFDRISSVRYPSPSNAGVSSTTDYVQFVYNDTTWQVTLRRNRDGNTISYGYDSLRRMTSRGGTAIPSVTFTYDNFSRHLSATGSGQSVSWTYDALGRTLSQSNPLGAISYQYDLSGARTRMTWPDGFYVTYDRDFTGAVTALRENGATSGAGVLAGFAYDSLGRRSTLSRGNGVTTSYTFDPVSRLASLAHDLPGTANDQTLTFGYNAADQVTTRSSTNAAYAWSGLYSVNRPYTLNGLNQVASAGGAAHLNDGKGNLQSDGVTTYSYDGDNHLVGASGGASLAYDQLGRLFQVTSSGGSVTKFLYDGDDLIAEYGTGGLQRRYVHGPGIDEPLVWYEGSGTGDRRWLAADQQGSIISVSNGAGASLATNSYDEYGIPSAANLGRFQYTGQAWIPEVGVYHYKARDYAPALGRFLQPDPIDLGGGLNLYAYAGNDPVNMTDPSGLVGADGGPLEVSEVVVVANVPPQTVIFAFTGPTTTAYGETVSVNVDEIVVTGKRTPEAPSYELSGEELAELHRLQAKFAATRAEIGNENAWFAMLALAPVAFMDAPAPVFAVAKQLVRNCFEAGTLVETLDGPKPIETIKVGDQVLARNDTTGETAYKAVVALAPPVRHALWDVTYKTSQGRVETLHTTAEHPFRTGKGEWLPASSLSKGMNVSTAGEAVATIMSVTATGRSAMTYNFEVADFHTYFVGPEKLWVHNACDPKLARELAKQAARGSSDARRIMQGLIKDPRFPESTWGKFEYVHRGLNGENITVHFWRNLLDGIEMGFKVK